MPLQGAIAGCHCSVLSLWGEGKDQLWGVDMVPLLGAIVLCHGGVDVVPLQGAIVVCYGFGGVVRGGDDQLWEWTWCHRRGDDQLWGTWCHCWAIAGCHCSVLWWGEEVAGRHCSLLWFGGRVATNFGGVDGGRCWVPLQGAIVVCYGWRGHFFQIATAIGVLTSNRGGGRRTTLADWTWHQGAIAGRSIAVPS